MLQSNSHRTFTPAARQLALALLLLACPPGFAEPDLLSGDLGLSSSAPDSPAVQGNSLIQDSSLPDPQVTEPAQPKLSPAQAAALVRSKLGGQVMSVNRQQSDAGVIYGVKLLNSGRMRVINVDGQTGQLLNP